MKKYPNLFAQEVFSNNQVLSSLVINPPYKVDGFTTSPKISKLLNLPFGVRIDSSLLLKLVYQGVISMSLLMTAACILILSISLPIQKENNYLLSSAKSMTNEKYYLLANLQEVSSYNKLFSGAKQYSLKDTNQIIHIQNNNKTQDKFSETPRLIALNKYPSFQFAGF